MDWLCNAENWKWLGEKFVFPTIMFILGFLADRLSKKFSSKNKRILVKNTIVLFIDNILPNIEKYIENLDLLSSDIKTSDEFDRQPFLYIDLSMINRLKEYSIDTLNDSLVLSLRTTHKVKEEASKKLMELCKCVDYLSIVSNEISEDYNKHYNDIIVNLIKQWNDTYIKLLSTGVTSNDDRTCKYLALNMTDFANALKSTNNVLTLSNAKAFIEKIETFKRPENWQYEADIIPLLNELIGIYYQRIELNKTIMCDTYSSQLNEIRNRLKEIKVFYENKKINFWTRSL